MQETQGNGVDIVLNSLAGELLHASWQCVAEFGKMIEIGKRDFLEHGSLAMDLFGGNRAFFGVDLVRLLEKPGIHTRYVATIESHIGSCLTLEQACPPGLGPVQRRENPSYSSLEGLLQQRNCGGI
jgi:hypothetical protein